MKAVRVRNEYGRVYWVRGDHYAVSHPDFVIVNDEEPTAAPAPVTLADMSIADLRALAGELGVTLGSARSKKAIVELLEDRT